MNFSLGSGPRAGRPKSKVDFRMLSRAAHLTGPAHQHLTGASAESRAPRHVQGARTPGPGLSPHKRRVCLATEPDCTYREAEAAGPRPKGQ